ncbi:MAG: SipW-dependent-type signal peptide-containing protein [Clostridia bacterium]|nr:SipW-dependent-type signal peptide-containing protein [Clostridia bacterium]
MKSKKSALLLSFTSLLLCFAMLAGSTFAWFTDTATTGVNKIQAGNLDIELAYKNSTTGGEFMEANKETPVFDNNAQWEPGHVEYVVLKVSNEGNLALKYKLGINIANEVGSTNAYDNPFNLSDYIRFAVLDGDKTEGSVDRDALVAAATDSKLIKEGYSKEDQLLAGENNNEKIVTLVVWMPKTVGNEANHKAGELAPFVELGINVVATQLNYENDSFGPDYDKFADYPEVQPVTTADKLQEALASEDIDGKTIKLYDDIETERLQLTGKNVAFDLNGKSLNTEKVEVNNSTVVFGDSSENGGGTLATDDSYGVINAVDSKVTIQNGRFVSNYNKAGSSGYANVIQVRNSELTINDGYFENNDNVGGYNYMIKVPSYSRTEKTTVTINGGEFVSHRNYGYIVTSDSDANVEVVINGGEFKTTGSNSYLTNVKGSVVVNDCTFVAEGNNTVFNIPADSTVTVKGGTFSVNENSYSDTSLAGLIFHRKTNGWTSVYGTLLVDPVNLVKVNQPTYSGFLAEGATQSAKGTDGFYTISK